MPHDATWPCSPLPFPAPSREAIHVWRASLALAPDDHEFCRRLLACDELAKAGRFRFDRDRLRYTAARGLLRVLLGESLGVPPERVRFRYDGFGKPSLDPRAHDGDVTFSVAHSGGHALFALARERRVGLDLEPCRRVPEAAELARAYFSPAEAESLQRTPLAARDRAFLNAWTRKEAFAKAVGRGLSMDWRGFDVALAPEEPPRILATRCDPAEAARWSLYALDAGPDWVAALAAEGRDGRVSCWNLDGLPIAQDAG